MKTTLIFATLALGVAGLVMAVAVGLLWATPLTGLATTCWLMAEDDEE